MSTAGAHPESGPADSDREPTKPEPEPEPEPEPASASAERAPESADRAPESVDLVSRSADPEAAADRAGLGSLLSLRPSRGGLIAGLLCLLLGFAAAAQVRSTRTDTTFATARQDELVGILSDLSQRSERLRGATRDLEDTRARLERDVQGEAAVEEARRRATTYGILAGTVPAIGPGIELTISDPAGRVRSSMLLDALQELRDAGAEVIQVGDVRVGVGTFFVDAPDGEVRIDGRRLRPPYRFLVIGDPHTLSTALNIPGGVVRTLQGAGAEVLITRPEQITVRAVRSS